MIPPFRRDFDFARDPGAAVKALNLFTERLWTPVLTFVTPGDLSVAYSVQAARIFAFAQLRVVVFNITTSTFTHTTASGNLNITGLPDAASTSPVSYFGYMGQWRGITKANYTQVFPQFSSASILNLVACGSGQTPSAITTADMPTGGTVQLRGTIIYKAA